MPVSGLEKRLQNLRPYQSGENFHTRKAAERSALKNEIIAELGGNLFAADAILLTCAVELLTVKPRSHKDAVRAANTANRILRELRAKYAARQIAPSMTARELLDQLDGHDGSSEQVG
jgi:hypothetical protein